MALINCPECSKEVSDKAPACPNCGVVLNASSTEKVHSVIWGWWMGLSCLLGFVVTGSVMLWGPQLFLVFVFGSILISQNQCKNKTSFFHGFLLGGGHQNPVVNGSVIHANLGLKES